MIRVLLVDDDALVRAGLSMILGAAEDIEIVGEAGDGEAGVAAVRTSRPDVVLMDIRMPGVDGLAATERIAALPDPPQVLVLTTFAADEYVFGALQAGAIGFLLKDTPPRELADAVRTVAAGKAMLTPEHTRALIDRYAGGGARREEARARLEVLSDREREVAAAVARGLSNAEIAGDLYLSEATVKAHLAHVFTKLDLNRVQVAILAHDAGLTGG
ncbi:response regulator transcription factor [Mobilicoccus caccae]|uniref:DNA-binding response regulator n=1 Tax=Mobilicoccus caccae TaxID=1859295 RepID=A0ABQ6IZP2_9MICO|nr:response regulator transcription factor [Mobilicoccus caccae]GMA42172.1 DNA-binding response regulator [Mobilicoccus caccae]